MKGGMHMKLSNIINNPLELIFLIGIHGGFRFLSDEQYLKLMYRCQFREKLNLKNPQTANEKLQWLKLYDHNPEYITMVDKYEVKQFVSNKIRKEYVIPTLGVWNKFDDINFDDLPKQFVLKCTHDSGSIVICRDKTNFNIGKARKQITHSLKRNYYWVGREWPYKGVKPRIIAEKYLEDFENKGNLTDYKIYCFNGMAKLLMVATDRYSASKKRFDYFDENGKWIDMSWGVPNSGKKQVPPPSFEKLKKTAEALAKGITHVRVDLYIVNENIYFGEMTFYDGSGFDLITPYEWNVKIGSWIQKKDNTF